MPTVKQLYRNFTREHCFCWACGRDGSYCSMPADWCAWFGVERAHIVNHPRVEDRRVIAALCSLCHSHFHGRRVITADRSLSFPALELAHLLALKSRFDPEYFDLDFIQRHNIRRLPEPEELPECYRLEFQRRRAA